MRRRGKYERSIADAARRLGVQLTPVGFNRWEVAEREARVVDVYAGTGDVCVIEATVSPDGRRMTNASWTYYTLIEAIVAAWRWGGGPHGEPAGYLERR